MKNPLLTLLASFTLIAATQTCASEAPLIDHLEQPVTATSTAFAAIAEVA